MTNEQKKQILELEIKKIESEMYPLEVRARVAKKVGDTQLGDRVIKELERLEKYLDGYKEEMEAL